MFSRFFLWNFSRIIVSLLYDRRREEHVFSSLLSLYSFITHVNCCNFPNFFFFFSRFFLWNFSRIIVSLLYDRRREEHVFSYRHNYWLFIWLHTWVTDCR